MGKIRMGGSATMEFESDYYEFHITVSATSEDSGNAISKGRSRTEEVLRMLQDKLGFNVKDFTLKDESINPRLTNGYWFEKQFYFCYKADNSITESILEILEKMSNVKYEVKFRLENKSEKEQLVMSAAVNNAREKAEKLATALGSHIIGFKEIMYEFYEETNEKKMNYMCACNNEAVSESLASDLKNPRIEISKSVEIIWITD